MKILIVILLIVAGAIAYKRLKEKNAKTQPGKAGGLNTSRILKRGVKGAEVTALQKLLISRGHKLPKFGADGDFGHETETALMSFMNKSETTLKAAQAV